MERTWIARIARAGMLAAALAAAPARAQETDWPGSWELGHAEYGVVVETGVAVAMDDGVALNATIHYPADLATGARAEGEFPVLIQFTPYRDEAETLLVEHGYIAVNVRPRGTGASPGEYNRYGMRDQRDGVALVDWASKLDGSDGRVGMYGCSYPAMEALLTAAQVGPGSPLKAIVAACNGLDTYEREAFIRGGVMSATVYVGEPAAWASAGANEFNRQFMVEMLDGGPRGYAGSVYWEERSNIEDAAKIVANGIPVLLWTGWDDLVVASAMQTYAALQNAEAGRPVEAPLMPGDSVSGRHQIIVGNTKHARGLDPAIYVLWFDTFVKGEDTGIADTETPMHLFEKGTNRWINATSYPLVEDYAAYHLAAGGVLSPGPAAAAEVGTLAWAAPAEAQGALTYETAPLADGATLAGPVAVTIHARSSNTNLQFLTTLYDVAPDGTTTPVSNGALVGSQRRTDPARSWQTADGQTIRPFLEQAFDEYLTPGEPYRFDIPMLPALWSVGKGHALRLVIHAQPPASCERELSSRPCYNTRPQLETLPGGVYTLLAGAGRESAIHLPLLPMDAFAPARSAVTTTSSQIEVPMEWSTAAQ